MKKEIETRVLEEASYIIKTKKTIREIARTFSVSKSTVHKDLSYRLKKINSTDYDKVSHILLEHIKIRHIRGGESTRRKYLKLC